MTAKINHQPLMRAIKDLINYYNETMSSIEKSKFVSSLNTKELEMWNYLTSKDKPNETTLVKRLYGVANPSYTSYQYLKGRIRTKLKAMELLDISGSEIQRKKKEVLQEYVVIKSMELKGLHGDIIRNCTQCLKKAEKYQMYSIAVEILYVMALHSSVYAHEYCKADEYRALAREYDDIVRNERDAETTYSRVIQIYSNSNNAKVDAKLISTYADTIDLEYDSHRLHFFYYFIKTIEYHVSGDIDNRITMCKDAIAYFQELHFRHSRVISIFRLRLINAYLHRLEDGDLGLVENLIGFEMSEPDKTAHDIVLLKHELIRVKCQRKQYGKAYELIKTIKIPKVVIEHERNLLIVDTLLLQIVNNDLDQVSMRKIKHNTKYSQDDKRGLGLTLLVAECVYYVMIGKAALIEDRKRHIDKYIQDHLDMVQHAKEIELLNIMTGSTMVLSDTGNTVDRMIVPTDMVRRMVVDRLGVMV